MSTPVLSAPVREADRAAVVTDAGDISARLDRLPATWTVWKLVIMLSLGLPFELHDLLITGYVGPGLVKAGILSSSPSGRTCPSSRPSTCADGLSLGCQTFGFSAVPIVAYLSYLPVPQAPLGWDGWRWIVVIGCIGAVAVWFIRLSLPESPRWLAMKGRLDEVERIMAELERRGQAETGRPLPRPAPAEPVVGHGRFAEMWAPPYRNRAIMLVIFNVFQRIGPCGFANWVPTLLIKQGVTVTTSLGYTTVIALAAPVGPLLAERFERNHVIVAMAGLHIVFGLLFSQASSVAAIIAFGVPRTLAGNIISFSYHTDQQEPFPTGIRARAVGFVYSWSRFSAILNVFLIAFTLEHFGVLGVSVFIAGAMIIVMLAIVPMGPRTRGLELEKISH